MEDMVVLSMVDMEVEVVGLEQVGEGQSLREKRSAPRPACRSGTECSLPGFPTAQSKYLHPLLSTHAWCRLGSQVLGPRPTAALPEAGRLLPGCLSFPTCTVGEHVL